MVRRALVIEGGGMKAAYANGVLVAFEEAGGVRAGPFDAVYGTSAGGALAAWFAAGQAGFARETWAYANDARIMSYRRWLTGRGPILDHEFLLDKVYGEEHRLDVAAVRACPVPVIVTASDVASGECHYQDLRHGDVLRWLKATGRLPFASGPAVDIDGRRFIDGGITDPLPVRRAVEDGHDHVVLVVNKPKDVHKPDNNALARLTARRYPALRRGILEHAAIKDEAMRYALRPPDGVRVDIIRPSKPTGLHRLSRDMGLITAAIQAGIDDGRAYLGRASGRAAGAPTAGDTGKPVHA